MPDTSAPFWKVDAATVPEIFRTAAVTRPNRIYCKSTQGTLSYAQAAGAIAALAQQLSPRANGKTVGIVLPNSPAFLIAYFAVLAAGGRPALLNHAHPDATIAKLLDNSDLATTLSDRTIDGIEVTAFDDNVAFDLAMPIDPATLKIAATSDAAGAILFSGGTTGLPKQVPHSNRSLIAKVERMEWGWPTGEDEIWLPVAPFTHVYGFLMGVLNPVLRAGTIVIPPRFHPDLIVDMLHDDTVTVFGGGPPAIYQAIMSSEKFTGAKFANLRVCPGGGAPFPLDVHRRWQKATGLPITEGYGMTEIAPICVNTESDGIKPGAAGKAVPDTIIEIVDLKDGKTRLAIGETGEIRVRGPHMMEGYTDNAEETAIAMRDGFVYTGDIGRLDADGFLTISDRKKDVIFVKGFNVFPREVEELLLSHENVSGVCVVGRADDRSGETPVAFVTLRQPADPQQLVEYCQTHLTDYKCPSEIVIMDNLPLTPAGKVDRTALRTQATGRTS